MTLISSTKQMLLKDKTQALKWSGGSMVPNRVFTIYVSGQQTLAD
jgi:hypothetical protein